MTKWEYLCVEFEDLLESKYELRESRPITIRGIIPQIGKWGEVFDNAFKLTPTDTQYPGKETIAIKFIWETDRRQYIRKCIIHYRNAFLNNLGEKGWELVSEERIEHRHWHPNKADLEPIPMTIFTFKRPKK